MPVIAAIGITISAITSGFVTAIKFGAEAALKLVSTIAKLSVEMVKFAGQVISKVISSIISLSAEIIKFTTIALVGLGAAMIAISVKAIKTAASFEELESKFETLLKSAVLAKQRMKELKQFAAETPFQIKGIAAASVILQALTKGALATGKGLRMVGDAAAVAGRPMNELAVQIGRVFQAAISGRKAGEALARLQELGLLSGEARTEFEDLQKASKKGTEVFAIISQELNRTDGAMARLSKTASGLFSTLKDNLNLALAELGQIFAPFVKVVLVKAISAFQKLSALIKDNAAAIKIFIASGIKKIAPIFLNIAKVSAAVFDMILKFFNVDGINVAQNFINSLIKGFTDFSSKVLFITRNIKEVWAAVWTNIKVGALQVFSLIGANFVSVIKAAGSAAAQIIEDKFGLSTLFLKKDFNDQVDAIRRLSEIDKKISEKEAQRRIGALRARLEVEKRLLERQKGFGFEDFFAVEQKKTPERQKRLQDFLGLSNENIQDAKAKLDKLVKDINKAPGKIKLENLDDLKGFNNILDDLISKIRFDEFGAGILSGVGEVMNAVQLLGKAADEVNDAGEKALKSKLPTLALAGSQAAARGELGLLGPDKMLKVAQEQLEVQKQIRDKPAGNAALGAPADFGFGGS